MSSIKIGDIYKHTRMKFVFIIVDIEEGAAVPTGTLLFIKSTARSNKILKTAKINLDLLVQSISGIAPGPSDYEKIA